MYTRYQLQNLKGRANLIDPGMDARIILKCIIKAQGEPELLRRYSD
jgi:hypothetical protein